LVPTPDDIPQSGVLHVIDQAGDEPARHATPVDAGRVTHLVRLLGDRT
jgi:hypothetical protein